MSNLSARTGRDRQRYDNNFRLVSGCIPYRLVKEDEEDSSVDFQNKLQVLMVSSPNRHDLVFPKGGWEDDETVLEAASREAMEEAGVKGILREDPLGVWEFKSKSSSVEPDCFLGGGCKGYMFALEVTEELETWPEHENRERRWLNVKEALELCRYEWMQCALEEFLRVMAEDGRTEEEALAAASSISNREECQIGSSRERLALQDNSGGKTLKPIIHFQTWRVGILVFLLGNCLNFISFGYAAQSLLAALGSIQFVSNIAFAYVVLNKWSPLILVATAFIVLGNVFLVAFGNHQSPVFTPEQLTEKYRNVTFLVYCGILIVIVAVNHFLYR